MAVMLMLAAGLYFGSRIPPQVAGHANLTFVHAWLAISGLIIVMLGLALLDWISTRLYARRHHRDLGSERRKILREALRQESPTITPASQNRRWTDRTFSSSRIRHPTPLLFDDLSRGL